MIKTPHGRLLHTLQGKPIPCYRVLQALDASERRGSSLRCDLSLMFR